jgi:hypothetical protein
VTDFEHFEEQQRSYELLDQHRELLARDAIELAGQYPTAQFVGLIMEADASEAKELRRLLEEATGRKVGTFVGLVPRKMVLEILRANAPQTLDFLEPASSGRQRRLALVAVTKHGYRFGAVDYEVPL